MNQVIKERDSIQYYSFYEESSIERINARNREIEAIYESGCI